MWKPRLIVAPAAEVVTRDEAKAHARVDHSDEDALIDVFVAAARERFDGWRGLLGRCIIHQTWGFSSPRFSSSRLIRLPFPDVTPESVQITYFDAEDVERSLASTQFDVIEDADGAAVLLKSGETWPSLARRPDAVTIEFQAGFGATAAEVPAAIRAAILLHFGHLYENREDVSANSRPAELPQGSMALVEPYRFIRL